MRPQEPVQLGHQRLAAVKWLSLKAVERGQLAHLTDNPFHGVRPERADQLVFEIGRAHEESTLLERGGLRIQRSRERGGLGQVDKTRKPRRRAMIEPSQVAAESVSAADGLDHDPFREKVTAEASSECLDGSLVAGSLDDDDRVQ